MASSHVYAGPAATALPATPKRGGGGCAMNDTQTDILTPHGAWLQHLSRTRLTITPFLKAAC